MISVTNKRVTDYFIRHVGEVTYWKPFKFGKHKYLMTFEYNLYLIN